MSDPVTTGTPAAAPSEPHPAPASSATPGSAETSAPTGTFGSTRGSGLARGKRPTQPAAASAAPVSTGYKPTSIEIVTHGREYKNPFASETPEVPPAAPVSESLPAVATPVAPVTQAPIPTPAPAPVTATPAPSSELFPFTPSGSAEKPATAAPAEAPAKSELNILPPAESTRASQSWENSSQPAREPFEPRARRDERPTFRPDRRDPREQPRDPRDVREPKFEPREPRRDPRLEQRAPLPPRPPAAPVAAVKKSGGFLGWLKSLFGGDSTPSTDGSRSGDTATGRGRDDGEFAHRRRHRGGRGRGGFQGGPGNRGPREGQPRPEGYQSQGGEGRGEQQGGDGFRRRRRRGGRGRSRDQGSDPRPEGTQGGGNI